MKNFNTLEELREALMSDNGAVYRKIPVGNRFRIKDRYLERYCIALNRWLDSSHEYNHGFIFDLENWTRYEKPKKIVKESFEGFVSDCLSRQIQRDGGFELCSFSKEKSSFCNHKATITIEREVEDE